MTAVSFNPLNIRTLKDGGSTKPTVGKQKKKQADIGVPLQHILFV